VSLDDRASNFSPSNFLILSCKARRATRTALEELILLLVEGSGGCIWLLKGDSYDRDNSGVVDWKDWSGVLSNCLEFNRFVKYDEWLGDRSKFSSILVGFYKVVPYLLEFYIPIMKIIPSFCGLKMAKENWKSG